MPLEYSCFISYPHGQDDVLRPIIEDFVGGLSKEVYSNVRKEIGVDYKLLGPGVFWNEKLLTSLCKSACMIAIYTRLYFNFNHIYCAREYLSMELLEEKRLPILKIKKDDNQGLIIPVILRGKKTFPEAVSKKRQCYVFDDIDFADPNNSISKRYHSEIKEIGEFIADWCDRFDSINEDLFGHCDNSKFPSEEDARLFVRRLTGKAEGIGLDPFPGRAEE